MTTVPPVDATNVRADGGSDDLQMDADLNTHDAAAAAHAAAQQHASAAATAAAGPMEAMVHQLMQGIMKKIMEQVSNAFVPNGGQNPGGVPGTAGVPTGPVPWQLDPKMSNVRLDIKAFSRIDKFTDKKEEWTEWRAQVIEAIRECDKTFAD